MVVGQGRVDGRRAVVQADDFTVRGGAADAAIWQKMVYAERAGERAARAARAARRRHRRRRQRQVARDDGLHLRAVAARLRPRGRRTSSRVPVVAAALGPVAGLGAARVVARHFSRDRPRDGAAVRRRPAGRRRGDGRVARQGGARRRARADARGRRRQRGGRRGRRARPAASASSPTCRPTSWEAPPIAAGGRPARPARGGAARASSRASARQPYEMRRVLEARARPRLAVRARRRGSGARSITALARLGGRPGRRARLRPEPLRRRPHRRRLGQARALRRHSATSSGCRSSTSSTSRAS